MSSFRKVIILYGTQTGNSQDIAERIGRQLTRMQCKPQVSSIGDYPVSKMVEEQLMLFVCATTGNGEFPDSMISFWRFLLRKNLPTNSLSQLYFSVFGLGDSSYEKFNVVAKKLNKRLLQLGARELIPLSLADDQHELGYDGALDTWLLKLKKSIVEYYDLPADILLKADSLLPPKYQITFCENKSNNPTNGDHELNSMFSFPLARLKSNERVTSTDHFQAVHLLKFDIDSSISYEPGDVAVVFPENPKSEVDEFLSLVNVPIDKPFFVIKSDPEITPPKLRLYPCTIRECATSYFDIMSVPRRSFFEFFHEFSKDELEKEKLVQFTTAEGQEDLYDYCNRPRRTILEVLKDFPNTTPYVPFEYYFDMIPSIRPRSFSIASSLQYHPLELHLLVAVVNYKTRLQKPRLGLCSNWITKLQPKVSIPFTYKHGSISLPKSEIPIILIGPGTGCAPFRAFVEERALKEIGDNVLFFGCRYQERDFLFSDTWYEMCEKKLLKLFTAFSRDQEDKVYVQHRIAENGELLWELIHSRKAAVFVAGNAKQMPKGVKDAFIDIIAREGGLDQSSSLKYLQTLENQKRYQVETWA